MVFIFRKKKIDLRKIGKNIADFKVTLFVRERKLAHTSNSKQPVV
jgi:hypothetical protein